MRCDICDREDDSISFDRVDGRFSPCRTCQDVIYDTIQSYEKSDNLLEKDDEAEH